MILINWSSVQNNQSDKMGMYVLMELEDKNLIYSLNSTLKINIQFKGRVKRVVAYTGLGKGMGSHLLQTQTMVMV